MSSIHEKRHPPKAAGECDDALDGRQLEEPAGLTEANVRWKAVMPHSPQMAWLRFPFAHRLLEHREPRALASG